MAGPESKVRIEELMDLSGVKFGTSGARGPVTAMSDRVCYAYTAGFLQYLESRDALQPGGPVAVGGDLRPSTDRILRAVVRAVTDRGYSAIHCGAVPSPTLALYGIQCAMPAVMVTGSHIPADRNGIKYNSATGEILKADEEGIRRQQVGIPNQLFDEQGMFRPGAAPDLAPAHGAAAEAYVARYTQTFPPNCLAGVNVALYEHSAVGRELLGRILTQLGAAVRRVGFSEVFLPVDTEAMREEDVALAQELASTGEFDAVVSTDGDGDRPLISDETGNWLRGDVAGILSAAFLGAHVVVVPVSCNTALETCGWFREVRRTRIGSPYVIAEMENARRQGRDRVVGYEANGGFLIASPLPIDGNPLEPLPTRDATVVILSVLVLSARRGVPVSRLLTELPQRFTASGRLQEFPVERSRHRIAELVFGDERRSMQRVSAAFGGQFGEVRQLDLTDGVRATFTSGEIVHLRPSGNAPEFRCYTEADSESRAREISRICLATMAEWRKS